MFLLQTQKFLGPGLTIPHTRFEIWEIRNLQASILKASLFWAQDIGERRIIIEGPISQPEFKEGDHILCVKIYKNELEQNVDYLRSLLSFY